MSTKYSNPPLVEIQCEFNFKPSDWDVTLPALYFENIKKDFPNKKTINGVSIGLNINPDGSLDLNNSDKNNRYILQMYNDQNNLAVQISENVISINSLKPCIDWVSLKKLIIDKHKLYCDLSNNNTTNINIAYINKINVGNNHSITNLCKSFKLIPDIDLAGLSNSYQLNIETYFQEYNSFLVVQIATLKPEENMPAPVFFNISFVCNSVSKDLDISQWLEFAYEKINFAFENSLHEQTLKGFL